LSSDRGREAKQPEKKGKDVPRLERSAANATSRLREKKTCYDYNQS